MGWRMLRWWQLSASRFLLVLLVMMRTVGTDPVAAQEGDPAADVGERIARLGADVEQEQQALAQLDAQSKKAELELKTLRTEILKIQEEERGQARRLSEVEKTRQDAADDILKLSQQITKLEALSAERIRALYVHPQDEMVRTLLQHSGSTSFSHIGYYHAVVRSHDLRRLEEIHELHRSREEGRRELDTLSKQHSELLRQIKSKREALGQKLARQQELTTTLQKRRKQRETALLAVRAQLLRFEAVMASLTGGPTESPERTNSPLAETKTAPLGDAFEGPGLVAGAVLRPAKSGEIVHPFGAPTQTGSPSAGRSKGIEYAVAEGAAALAVAPAKVLFVGKIPVVGTIVILDHGQRFYSLYGRLSTVVVARGLTVEAGQELGSTGALVDGKNLYFELRKNGAPIDPTPYLPTP